MRKGRTTGGRTTRGVPVPARRDHRQLDRVKHVVDLADVQVIDVSAISVLFTWSQTLRAHGVDLVLSAPSPSALVALRGSGLYEMFTITRT